MGNASSIIFILFCFNELKNGLIYIPSHYFDSSNCGSFLGWKSSIQSGNTAQLQHQQCLLCLELTFAHKALVLITKQLGDFTHFFPLKMKCNHSVLHSDEGDI